MPRAKTKHSSIQRGDETYRVGDCVLLTPAEKGVEPYLAKIVEITKGRSGQLRVRWYYRPEDTVQGRKTFHGRNELYSSKHTDWVPVCSVMKKCEVLSLEEYRDLPLITEDHYFTRFAYDPDPRNCNVVDEIVAIYCVCGLPYNPDVDIVHCGDCGDWFHPTCVGLPPEELEELRERASSEAPPRFLCPDCRAAAQGGAAAAEEGVQAGGEG